MTCCPADMGEWREKRNRALLALDLDWARTHALVMGRNPPEATLLMALHKARVICTDLPQAARHASMAWLKERDLAARQGEPWPPDGSLPE